MSTEKIKKIIIIILIIIVILIILIIAISSRIFLEKNGDGDENEEIINPSQLEEKSDRIISEEGKIEDVNSFKTFYNAVECANRYIKSIKNANKEAIYKLLYENYINSNNIVENSVLENVSDINSEETLYVKKMYQQKLADDENQYIYIDGLLRKTNNNVLYERSIFLTIIINQSSGTFSIVPNKDKFPQELQDLEEINRDFKILNVTTDNRLNEVNEEEFDDTNIIGARTGGKAEGYSDEETYDVNNINIYREQDVSNEYIARAYFTDYITNLKYYGKSLYSNLDESYREERFGSINEFEKYIKDISKNINKFTLESYAINEYDDYTECTCIDKYGNYYLFNITSVMNYTIKLDDYTVKTSKYISNYNGLSDDGKVSKNIDTFIQMLNTKDYKHAYQVLDESYRNDNFGSGETFKAFVNDNFFEFNSKESLKVEENGQYYIATLELTDATEGVDDVNSLTIIMKLEEGTDFVMSFDIK